MYVLDRFPFNDAATAAGEGVLGLGDAGVDDLLFRLGISGEVARSVGGGRDGRREFRGRRGTQAKGGCRIPWKNRSLVWEVKWTGREEPTFGLRSRYLHQKEETRKGTGSSTQGVAPRTCEAQFHQHPRSPKGKKALT